MTRFDYSDLDAYWLAWDYAMLNCKCPECLAFVDLTETPLDDDYTEVGFTCSSCGLSLYFGTTQKIPCE